MIFGSRCTQEQILALAGVAQCSALVDELAVSGNASEEALGNSIDAFFLRNSEQLNQFFSRPGVVSPGLSQLELYFSDRSKQERARQIGYTFQMIHLSKQMAKRPDMLGVIGAGIDRMELQRDDLQREDLLSAIGDLYQQTISKLSFRIQVQGQHGYLRQSDVASTIRAMLFCGIRFAHLWRQQGGSQVDFLLRKSAIRKISGDLAHSSSINPDF